MFGYIVSRQLILSAGDQHKTLQPAGDFAKPATREVYISSHKEIELLRTALKAAFPDEPLGKLLRILPHESVAHAPGMPVMLGAHAFPKPVEVDLENCLARQLQVLKTATPWRRHYRLLLINAFGANLGDTMIGLTAFRQVLQVLQAELPAISVDVMLGWHKGDGLTRLFRAEESIDTLLTQGQTLAELTRYQMMFDTSALLYLPRFGKMPLVDWYLWWMGVDPATVPAQCKRNSVAIPDDARESVTGCLPPASGQRILFNPKASVPLRSLPEETSLRLVEYLLAALPASQIILIQPLPVEHPRVVNLSGLLPTVDHLAALVAQVDGVIGVDTYTQHLADATDTPAVTLFASVEPDLYPYYPFGEAVLAPDARQLPGWGKMKVTPAAWEEMSGAYEAAWRSLDLSSVLDALRRAMCKKGSEQLLCPSRLLPPRSAVTPQRHRLLTVKAVPVKVPLRQRDDDLAVVLSRTLADIAGQVLCKGDTVALLGAGAGEVALELALAVGQHGRLVAFEPRRELHQLLCANLVDAGICHAETHAVMPDAGMFAVRESNRLRIADEYAPLDLANSAEPESVVCWPLDVLSLNACQLLVACSPLPLLSVLRGARGTIARLSPVVLAGLLRLQESAALEEFFAAINYQVRILEIGSANNKDKAASYGIVVAEPATIPC